MPDRAYASARQVEALVRLPGREDVLPHGIPRAGVVEADLALGVRRLEAAQKAQRLLGDRLARPAGRRGGARGEVAQGNVPGHDQVVISGEADVAALAGQGYSGVGLRAVAHEVAEAPELVDRRLVDPPQDRFEGWPVAVHVGEHGDAHLASFYSLRGEAWAFAAAAG